MQIIRVRCPGCQRIFALPTPVKTERYARVTRRSRELALSLLVKTNGSLQQSSTVANELAHVHIPRSTLHDWKQSAAGESTHEEILKRIQFSGVLCVDEYRPLRSKVFDLFASDRKTGRILYLNETEDRYAISGDTAEQFFRELQGFSLIPKAIIADMSAGIHKGALTVFPNALLQYDYFHVIKAVHEKLRSEIRYYWWTLKQAKQNDDAALVWDAQWSLLKNQENWTITDEAYWKAIYLRCPGTLIAWLPAFKQELRDIFDESKTIAEAYSRRDQWIAHWQSLMATSKHLKKIFALMQSNLFPYMITYLDYSWLPRTTNAETLIRTYRKMEKARYGFGSIQGRQNHLKLFQLKNYLTQNVG